MIISRRSQLTGQLHIQILPIKGNDLKKWRAGKDPIQEVMPYLTRDQQEFLMTGIVPEELTRSPK